MIHALGPQRAASSNLFVAAGIIVLLVTHIIAKLRNSIMPSRSIQISRLAGVKAVATHMPTTRDCHRAPGKQAPSYR
eukprot:6191165-Pleurochrysis_carterae.AAC.2